MKRNKLSLLLALSVFAAAAAFADEDKNTSPFNFSLVTDFAYYPYAENKANPAHDPSMFSPITGPYDGIEGRITAHAVYTIPTPLGTHWLVSGANLQLDPQIELTPVSIMPGFALSWSPVPFLVFNAGAQAGTGWSLGTFIQGTGFYDPASQTYVDTTFFKDWFVKAWAQATFQFDTGAIWPGDWTHILMQFTYQTYYSMYTGAADGSVWKWQATGNKANGWQEYMCGILAYEMPMVLKRVGLMFESEGHYNASDYYNPRFMGDFKEIGLSPFIQLDFTKNDILQILFNISSRRSFESGRAADEANKEPNLNAVGREWYFKRLAFRYTHNF